MSQIPGPSPAPAGRGNMVPAAVWAVGYVEVGENPRSGQPQRVACYECVLNGLEPAVPQIYVMVKGTSLCIDHARES